MHPVEKAINEQARGFVPLDGLENGKRGKRLTKQQIFQPRRKTEDILIEMVDNLRTRKEPDQIKPKKAKKRRRRRGPKVLVVNFT